MQRHCWVTPIKTLVGLLLLATLSTTANTFNRQQPDPFFGWSKAGFNTDQYHTGFLEKAKESERHLGFIKALQPSKRGFGTLMQTAGIEQYKGQRIQLTAYIKTAKAKSAGAWFRVNGEKKTLAFDNMNGRRLTGTNDWKKVTLVLDIPHEAESVSYGVLLEGKGQVWFEQPTFQIVNLTVRTTEQDKRELLQLQLQKQNLFATQQRRRQNIEQSQRAVKAAKAARAKSH